MCYLYLRKPTRVQLNMSLIYPEKPRKTEIEMRLLGYYKNVTIRKTEAIIPIQNSKQMIDQGLFKGRPLKQLAHKH